MHLKDVDTQAAHRWSELVPPRTALTFAAMWDPEDGMVTFSGARLLDSETLEKGQLKGAQDDSPRDVAFTDDQSQVLTIDRFATPGPASAALDAAYPPPTTPAGSPCAPEYSCPLPSAGMDSFAFAQQAMMADVRADSRSCLRIPTGFATVPPSPAAASSMALASLMNVPFRRTMMQNAMHRLSHIRQSYMARRPEIHIETEDRIPRRFDGRPYSADDIESVTDEGFCEGHHRMTAGTFGTAPVLVEVNMVRPFVLCARARAPAHPRTCSPLHFQ